MSISTLLDFIAKYESGGDYNIVWGGIERADNPPMPLTEMTVGEVLAWQDSIDAKYMSEASGRYQIMEDTLRGLYRTAGVPLTAKYDEATQDKLATALLRRRGLDDYLAGRWSVERFANSLAREWASMPVVTAMRGASRDLMPGQSYYAGDGLNKAHAPVGEFMTAIRAVKADPQPDPAEHMVKSRTMVGGGAAGVGTAGNVIVDLADTAKDQADAVLPLVGYSDTLRS